MTVINMTDGKLNSVGNDPEINVVAELERLLQLARDGRIRIFALVALGPGEAKQSVVGDGDIITLLGFLRRLDHYMNMQIDETESLLDGG